MLEIYLLLLFMIAAAVVAVEIEDLISSVVAVGAVGLGVSVSFLLLKAPDLAITQLVVEILALVILIRATIKKDIPRLREARSILILIACVALIFSFLAFSYFALKDLPSFGEPAMRVAKYYIQEGLKKTGATNLVAAILLDFRGYDTLGEATVLFTAVIGALAVLRKVGRKKVGEKDEQ